MPADDETVLSNDAYCMFRDNDSACEGTVSCQTGECEPDEDGADNVTGCVFTNDDSLCDDGLDCADETCAPGDADADPVSGCKSELWPEGDECTDEDLCTEDDTCSLDGHCIGTQKDCSAEDTGDTCRDVACFDSACLMVNASEGRAVSTPKAAPMRRAVTRGSASPAASSRATGVCFPPSNPDDPTSPPICMSVGGPDPQCYEDTDCDDGYPCTEDICMNSGGYLYCANIYQDIPACHFDMGACCTESAEAGCQDLRFIEHCVCDMEGNDACCDDAWTNECIEDAKQYCGLVCTPELTPQCGDSFCDPDEDEDSCPQDCGVLQYPCCTDKGQGGVGCADDTALEQCVCNIDPFCCGNGDEGGGFWDETCVLHAWTTATSAATCCVATMCVWQVKTSGAARVIVRSAFAAMASVTGDDDAMCPEECDEPGELWRRRL